VAVADLGGDRSADILLRNSTSGQLWLFQMFQNVIEYSNNIGGLSTDWDIADVTDLGGDGKADILLRHVSRGQLWLYEMDANVIDNSSNIGGLPLIWQITN